MRLFQSSLNSGGQTPPESNIVNVLIMTGQSNSVGYAYASDLTDEQRQPYTNINLWNIDTNQFNPMQVGVNDSQLPYTVGERHGINIPIGDIYYDNFSDPLYIIKYGWGGTSIVELLDHDYGNDDRYIYGELWNDYIVPGINDLLTQGKRPKIWVMFGGWEDSNTQGETFETRFRELETLFRDNTGNQDIPFFANECCEPNYTSRNVEWRRLEQISEFNLLVTEASDLLSIGDDIHFNSAAFHTMADRLVVNLLLKEPAEITDTLSDVTWTTEP